jgi:hypothetical protein
VHAAATMVGMKTADDLHNRAAELAEAARAFQAAAEQPGSHAGALDALESLEEALQVLSGAWYQLAADASPGIVARRRGRGSEGGSWPRVDGLSRQQEVHLMGTLHDVAAAFARCARACREGRSTAMPAIARRVAAEGFHERGSGDELSWFKSHQRQTQRVA